jgi:hypothetical protein
MPVARSGVHAVHAGPVLAVNLLAALKGGTTAHYKPHRQSLYILACGPRYAIASWGRFSAEGQWVWRWKDWIDRRFISRFSSRSEQDSSAQKTFLQLVFSIRIIKSSFKVALVVGTVLNLINNFEGIRAGQGIPWFPLLLNYFVPYCVASYAAATNETTKRRN